MLRGMYTCMRRYRISEPCLRSASSLAVAEWWERRWEFVLPWVHHRVCVNHGSGLVQLGCISDHMSDRMCDRIAGAQRVGMHKVERQPRVPVRVCSRLSLHLVYGTLILKFCSKPPYVICDGSMAMLRF